MLESSLVELADLLRAHDEEGLANWITHSTLGDPETLPRRVLQMFTRGMGGLRDRPLYTDGQLDTRATAQRDVLANRVFEQARTQLHEVTAPDPSIKSRCEMEL